VTTCISRLCEIIECVIESLTDLVIVAVTASRLCEIIECVIESLTDLVIVAVGGNGLGKCRGE